MHKLISLEVKHVLLMYTASDLPAKADQHDAQNESVSNQKASFAVQHWHKLCTQ